MNTHNLTAAEAAEIRATGERRRAGNCAAIMDHTLARVAEAARAGKRSYVVRGVGAGVDLDAFMAELKLLGYVVRARTEDESVGSRDIVVEW